MQDSVSITFLVDPFVRQAGDSSIKIPLNEITSADTWYSLLDSKESHV